MGRAVPEDCHSASASEALGGWSEAEVCAEEVAAPRMTLRRIRSAGKSKSGIGERKRPLLCSGRGKIGIGKRKVAFVQITAHGSES